MTGTEAVTAMPLNAEIDEAYAIAERDYIERNPGSRRAFESAKASLPGGNSRSTVHFSPFPLCLGSGRGGSVTDVDGRTYTDFVNEHTAAVFGHSNKTIAEAISRAVASGFVLGGPCLAEQELAGLLTRRFPAVEKVRFCNSGTEANILAIGTAMAFTRRPAVMVFEGGYHGSVLQFSAGAGRLNVPFEVVRASYNDGDDALRSFRDHGGRLAAVIVEPMQGGAGAIAGDREFLALLAAECAKHGALLIFDEVMTSRLAPRGLHGQLGLKPDLVTLGKYIGGGLALGAFGGREDVMRQFDPAAPDAIFHGGTFNNNVLAMTAGAAALGEVMTDSAVRTMNGLGDRFRDQANAFVREGDLPVQITGVGSIFGLHFTRGAIRNASDLRVRPAAAQSVAKLKALFQLDMLERGFYVTRRILGNLSLETSGEDMSRFLEVLKEFLLLRGSLIRKVAQAACPGGHDEP
ncbi:MAG: aspartate aminotransferase family protein [Parvibaculaceae bacterium]